MSRYAMCSECGHRLSRVYDGWGNWDGESYVCYFCGDGLDRDDDDIPEGCAACGGPYPQCVNSCNMFDD